MIKNRDIIVIGIQPWAIEIGSNCKKIAEEFARNNRVMYVNYPPDRSQIYRNKNQEKINKHLDIVKSGDPEIFLAKQNLWNLIPATILESISWITSPRLFEILNRINNKRIAAQILKAVKTLGFKDYIVFNDSDIYRSFYMKELLKPETYVYYTHDNQVAIDNRKKQGERMESLHMKKADLVVANSKYLADQARKHNPNSFYVGQGFDVNLFDSDLVTSIPPDIQHIPKPIVGYIGTLLSVRLDIEVLEYIAVNRPDWSVVLIGPEDEKFKKSRLHQFENVFFLGNKTGDELPSYLNVFNVAINPQVLSPLTIGKYPRKIDEYLAMGKPTVATKTEAMNVFADHTYLAENKEDYVQRIEKAMMENNAAYIKDRKEFARRHTWENNVSEIARAINIVKSSNIGWSNSYILQSSLSTVKV